MLANLGLCFCSPDLEREYVAERTLSEFSPVDSILPWLHVTMATVVVLEQWARFGAQLPSLLALGLWLTVVGLWWVVWRFRRDLKDQNRWMSVRSAIYISWRAAFFPLAVGICYPRWYSVPVTDAGLLMRYFLGRSGLFIMVVFASFMPMLVRYHIPVHAATLAALTVFCTPRVCAVAVHAPEAHRLFSSLWDSINDMSQLVVNHLYLTRMEPHQHPDPAAACEHATTWWLCVAGFMLPTCILWVLEHRSRSRFLMARPAEQAHSEHGEIWQPLDRCKVLWYAAPGVVFVAVSWFALMRLYAPTCSDL